MTAPIDYSLNRASAAEIAAHLRACDADFVPPLRDRVEIGRYAKKIADRATRFEAWSGRTLIGLAALYCNDSEGRCAFITNVSVVRPWTGRGIAARLVAQCVEHAKVSGMRRISLEVESGNTPAIRLYRKCGFIADKTGVPFVQMCQFITGGDAHEQQA